ncbi:Putative hemolysin C [Gluconacetobacter sp. SXCC-1]|uniref:HlyC/CorC family transporter n=1 Tax=Komagataeibacter rhaeticus TaxID=215221 RepID=A0A181CBE2_9PROT|nr:hemolysin family protein [Komagataeibacter rhaeticus]ATU72490.1 HlyC/CorC family transporter [Komagataeibacter xylinus]EGG74829.1 Putative hemolysin C [Gluconacetobacter sp. SXCC-1]QIP35597.1 HlyC/CorC family transporter [Komagataeibacter rhaeticus]QOC45354.1 HlyC/CorC family transporter [Komagataeibacter rhaeticus]WPP22240.1 hemolysin family protein [Komagataeibacter rhaeticus]
MSRPVNDGAGGGEPPSGSRGKGFLSLFSRRRAEQGLRHSIAALVKEADDAAGSEGEPGSSELDRQERALLANVLRLRGITADDVMIPRADIVAMPVDISLDEALDMMRRENHSRMPVYRAQLDDIVGMIHVKDLIAYVGTSEAFRMEPLLRQPLMVAPQLPVLDLLLQMRQRHVHLALVIDEYGGIDGLVTIEDLIETIVGDISDEHDEPTVNMMRDRPDGTLDVDARTPVAAFEEKVGPVLTREEREAEIETVGGLVFRLAGHVPTRGEVVTHEGGMVFRILDSDARHIRRVRVRLPPREGPQPPPAVQAGRP